MGSAGGPTPRATDEERRRQEFLENLAADFAALRQDEAAWAEELAERSEWEVTLADGLGPLPSGWR